MKSAWISFALLLCSAGAQTASAQPPQAVLHSGTMTANFYLPDAANGFYRATRFDWGGVLSDLQVAGHHVYRTWFSETDPSLRDFVFNGDAITAGPNSAMTGPAEEFQKPIGYDAAKPGDTFLKIGVGLLRRGDDKPYNFGTHFDLVDGGHWTTTKTPDSITFTQTYGTPASDYAYVYTKTFRLVGGKNQMVLEHRLKNTGKLPIKTNIYDHNFFTLDDRTVGTGYTVTVPYQLKPTRLPDAKFVRIDGNTAEYIADLKGEDRVSFGLQGYGDTAKDYDIHLLNKAANFDVHIVGDHPLTNAIVWSIRPVIAVEPFIDVAAEPGKDFTWTYTYTYTDLGKSKAK